MEDSPATDAAPRTGQRRRRRRRDGAGGHGRDASRQQHPAGKTWRQHHQPRRSPRDERQVASVANGTEESGVAAGTGRGECRRAAGGVRFGAGVRRGLPAARLPLLY